MLRCVTSRFSTRRLAAAVLLVLSATVARAELPPLIPRTVLFGEPERTWPQISPDGRRLAYLAPSPGGDMNVWVRSIGAGDDSMVTDAEGGGIGAFGWAYDARHLLYFEDHHGDENLHLWSLDLETARLRDLTPFRGARATNLITSPSRPNEVLVGLNIRDRRVFDMYRVDLKSGAVTLDTENPGDVLGWTTDAEFQIRAAGVLRTDDVASIVRVRDGRDAPWRELVVTPFEESPMVGQVNGGSLVTGFAADGRSLYMATFRESDTMRLVQVDCATGREMATVAKHPRCDLWAPFDPTGMLGVTVLEEPRSGALQAVAFEEFKVEWKAIDRAVEADLAAITRATAPGVFEVLSRDLADGLWVVSSFTASSATRYWLYRRDTRKLELLFEDRPDLAQWTLATPEPVRFEARDGLSIPAYLTIPPGRPPKEPQPLVLLVHGGPWFRDSWHYQPDVQWLANRGYAVLQVQFRGSTGFGRKHFNAGNGGWGGAMQNDLTDAVRWAIREKITAPGRVAIMGGSYGGYATLAGLAFTPDLYACGVDIVGPSNVATTLASIPPYWAPVKRRWIRRVGDAENDAALNERISPLFHAGAIRAPLLIGHGANDPRVKQAESDRIVAALRERNLPVTYVVYPDEGHGFGRTENNLDFSGRVEEFLAKHLGGRAEPWVKIEGTSAELR